MLADFDLTVAELRRTFFALGLGGLKQGQRTVAAVPSFGDGNELSPEELAELEETVRAVEKAMATVQKDAAALDLQVGHANEITGRLLARIDTVRRSSRAPDELPRTTLSAHIAPVSDSDAASPGVCGLDYRELTVRKFTTMPQSNLTEGWTACTTMSGCQLHRGTPRRW